MIPNEPDARDPNKDTLRTQFVNAQRRTEARAAKSDAKQRDTENRTLRDEFRDAQNRTDPPAPIRNSQPKDIAYEHNGLGSGPKPPAGGSQLNKQMAYERLQQARDKHRRQEAPTRKPINKDIGHLPHVDGPKNNDGKKTLSEEFKDAQAKNPKDHRSTPDPRKKSK